MCMTKSLKPGQFCTIDKKLYRAKKETNLGTCIDCDFQYRKQRCSHVRCFENDVILQEVKIKKLHAQS